MKTHELMEKQQIMKHHEDDEKIMQRKKTLTTIEKYENYETCENDEVDGP